MAATRRSVHERLADRRFPLARNLQLSRLGRRRAGFQCRDLDAAHRAGLAGAHGAHGSQRFRRRNRAGAPVRPAIAVVALDRVRGRPFQPAKAADRNAGGDGRPRFRIGRPDRRRSRAALAVYLFAFLFGCAAAFDAPVRQTFVSELVGDDDLPNAVALNSMSFNAAQMLGPAVAGLVIMSVGSGWAFLINGASFIAVLLSLSLLRVRELRFSQRAARQRKLRQGIALCLAAARPADDSVMLVLIGAFGWNFPIFISTMAASVFHANAGGYGVLSSIMAAGATGGALLPQGQGSRNFEPCPSHLRSLDSASRWPPSRRATGPSPAAWSSSARRRLFSATPPTV